VQIIEKLKPLIQRKDMKYRFAILVGIRVGCSLYKFFHGVNYLQCSEMFTIGKSSMNMVLQNFVFVVNEVFRNQI
jgi:nitrate/TMAO reductase-like tetraheme cytochrome c subunit